MSWKFLKYLWWVVSISKKKVSRHWNWGDQASLRSSYLLIRNVISEINSSLTEQLRLLPCSSRNLIRWLLPLYFRANSSKEFVTVTLRDLDILIHFKLSTFKCQIFKHQHSIPKNIWWQRWQDSIISFYSVLNLIFQLLFAFCFLFLSVIESSAMKTPNPETI